MGKKKSKTSKTKQKQAATGRKLSKTFAKKLGISEGKPEDMMVDRNSSAATSMNKKNKHARRSRNPMKDSKAMIAGQKKASPGSNEEKTDFDSQQASMNERERFVTWKRNDIKKNNSKNNASSTLPSQNPLQLLQPASFCTTDAEKSTSCLVQETLHQVSGLSGIGANVAFSNTTHPSQGGQQQGQSSLAMAVASSTERWTAEVDDPPDKAERKNPWAILGTGDEDDDDDAGMQGARQQQQIPQPSPFQFAPATFSFGNTTNDNSNNNIAMAGEIDPDL
jgi:hypothetical protein